MAAGLPVVANPVGMNRMMVVHGETGFLASTPQEWAEAIARLAADPHLRHRMGRAGRRLVADRYSVAVWSSRLAAAVDAVARNLLCQSSVRRAGMAGSHHGFGRGTAGNPRQRSTLFLTSNQLAALRIHGV